MGWLSEPCVGLSLNCDHNSVGYMVTLQHNDDDVTSKYLLQVQRQRHRDGVLELDHLTLPLLFTSQLEVLGPLDGHLSKI